MTNQPGDETPPPDDARGAEPGPTPQGSTPEAGGGADPNAGQGPTPEQPPQPPGYQPGYWEQQAREQQAQQPPAAPYPPYQAPYPPGPAYPAQAYVPEHPKATTSLVLGILGLVLCQVLGPFAWAMGKRTMDEIDASHGRLGGRGAAQAGYVLGIVATVLLGLSLVFLMIYVIFAVAVIGGGIATN